jgi:hypothetical protein
LVFLLAYYKSDLVPWRRGLVVSAASEEIWAMDREIESRQGVGWKLLKKMKYEILLKGG